MRAPELVFHFVLSKSYVRFEGRLGVTSFVVSRTYTGTARPYQSRFTRTPWSGVGDGVHCAYVAVQYADFYNCYYCDSRS